MVFGYNNGHQQAITLETQREKTKMRFQLEVTTEECKYIFLMAGSLGLGLAKVRHEHSNYDALLKSGEDYNAVNQQFVKHLQKLMKSVWSPMQVKHIRHWAKDHGRI